MRVCVWGGCVLNGNFWKWKQLLCYIIYVMISFCGFEIEHSDLLEDSLLGSVLGLVTIFLVQCT